VGIAFLREWMPGQQDHAGSEYDDLLDMNGVIEPRLRPGHFALFSFVIPGLDPGIH